MTENRYPTGLSAQSTSLRECFCINAPAAQTLADRLALVLGEHVACDDEMHLTYNAIQSGWQHDAGRDRWRSRPAHTQLFFEYSALLVLRSPTVDD